MQPTQSASPVSPFLASRATRITAPVDLDEELEDVEEYVPDIEPAVLDDPPVEGNPLEVDGLDPRPEQAFRCRVTPEIAAEWLTRLPKTQRTLKPERVTLYARKMRNGQWRYAHEPVTFDDRGHLIEGMHRLRAVVTSGVPVELMVTVGAPPGSFAVIDQGLNRSAEQFLGEAGEAPKYLSHVRTAVAFLWQIQHGLPYNATKTAMSWSQQPLDVQLAYLRSWQEVPALAPETATVARPTAAGIPPRLLLTVMAQASRTEHWPKIDEFLEGLRSGADLSEGDPRLALRARFAAGARDRARLTRSPSTIDAAYSMVVIGWNSWVRGEPLELKELALTRLARQERAKVLDYPDTPPVIMYDAA